MREGREGKGGKRGERRVDKLPWKGSLNASCEELLPPFTDGYEVF